MNLEAQSYWLKDLSINIDSMKKYLNQDSSNSLSTSWAYQLYELKFNPPPTFEFFL